MGIPLNAAPSLASSPDPQPAAASQSIAISPAGGGINYDTKSSLQLGSISLSTASGHGSTSAHDGAGSVSASLGSGPATTSGTGGIGGGLIIFPIGGGNVSANASSTLTYAYVFTANKPNLVQQYFANNGGSNYDPNSPIYGCSDKAPCLRVPGTPILQVITGTELTGSYDLSSAGYADASVSINGYGPTAGSFFSADCGTSFSGTDCGFNKSKSGTFKIFGTLYGDVASNSLYSLVTINANARLLEGGNANAMIDPSISLTAPGLNPQDFTLTLSQGFTNSVAPGVPEPATWAMMLLGFGMIGFAMRKRSNVRTTVSYA